MIAYTSGLWALACWLLTFGAASVLLCCWWAFMMRHRRRQGGN